MRARRMVGEGLTTSVRARLLLVLAVPFLVCALLAVVFVVSRAVSESSYRTALAWSEHAIASLEVQAAGEQFNHAVEGGAARVRAAAAELERARVRSLELAREFQSDELDEEVALSEALEEFVARGIAVSANPTPHAIMELRDFYTDQVVERVRARVAEEYAGSRVFAARGEAVGELVLLFGLGGAALLLALGVILCLRLARSITGSLESLQEQASRMARGELDGAIAVSSRDELGRLATAFNTMAENLRGSMIHRSELEALIEVRTHALLQTEAQLYQSQKLDAIGRLAGGVAHDFNNLLAVILASADLLAEELGPDHPARSGLEEIVEASDRAASLTRQLLAFSRKQPRKVETVAINDVLANLHKMLHRLVGEDIHLRTDLATSVGPIRGDVSQLEQIVTNLVVNARDAMPGGGHLTIATADVELDGAEADAAGVAAGEYVMISVADTGCGMDATTRAQIFEPFFTTKAPGKGTGLGLATVFGIVKQSEGGIAVETDVGAGSTFRIYLPRADAAAARRASSEPPITTRGSETLLVVEDEERVRASVVKQLHSRGYHVLEAADSRSALATLASRSDVVDLMVTDLVMPSVNGLDLAREVHRRWPAIAIVYMSGYTEHPTLESLGKGSDVPLIIKPFTADELAGLVRRTLSRRAAAP